jgi:hypothetical protein
MKAKLLGLKYKEVTVCCITQASAQKEHIKIFVRNFRLLSLTRTYIGQSFSEIRFSQKNIFQHARTALRHYTGYTVFAAKRVG